MTEGCLRWRGSAGGERPLESVRNRDEGRVHPLRANGSISLLVLLERGMERSERMTEGAVFPVGVARRGGRAKMMRALVVADEADEHGATREVVLPFGVWQRDCADTEAGEQKERYADPPNPRPRAKHHVQFSHTPLLRQAMPAGP